MSVNIVVPDLSESVVEATIADWLKKVGDPVQAGEAVVVLETDKVSLEVTATQAGVLSSIAYEVGADVKPGDVLGVIAESGEAVAPQPVPAPAQAAAPAAPVANAASAPTATPVARRVAAEHGVDLTQVPASSGRVTKDDVRSFINTQAAPAPAAPPPAAPTPRPAAPAPAPTPVPAAAASSNGYRREERVRMTRRRQTIAQRLVEAQQTAAMLTTFNEVDMSAVQAVRQRRKDAFKEKYGIGLGLSSFFVKAVIGALKAFPQLNAEIQGNEIVLKHYYDIGMAIGAKEGLVVPVLRDADRMSFAEIEKAIREYAKQSEEGTLSIEALRGGTFTITNGGVFGSLLSTPILNPPQVGILGLHGIKDRPVVVNGEIVVRPMMYTALTYDHRIVDGREAVQFLVKIKELIEDPETMLLEG
ncbi:MAG: 2-oxoglutarate dehydrogenase complex dihydrolipoyllysine-residue succinyltransferase [bacterium]|nr:2-oxoglutarate dehydrogenase complex dihydrolipoyllysine-residue succinyltransferase [bacterium]